jgi:hypothetical protein
LQHPGDLRRARVFKRVLGGYESARTVDHLGAGVDGIGPEEPKELARQRNGRKLKVSQIRSKGAIAGSKAVGQQRDHGDTPLKGVTIATGNLKNKPKGDYRFMSFI